MTVNSPLTTSETSLLAVALLLHVRLFFFLPQTANLSFCKSSNRYRHTEINSGSATPVDLTVINMSRYGVEARSAPGTTTNFQQKKILAGEEKKKKHVGLE